MWEKTLKTNKLFFVVMVLLIVVTIEEVNADKNFTPEFQKGISSWYQQKEDTEGWKIPDWEWEKEEFVAEDIKISKKYATDGKKSLELKADFPGGKWTAALIEVMGYFNWIDFGKISCDIYLPKKAPEGLKAKIVLSIEENCESVEMSRGYSLKPGKWVTVTADLKPGSTDWRGGMLTTNEFRMRVRKMAVRIESNYKPLYKGSIYVDNIRLTEPIKPDEMEALEKIALPDTMLISGFEESLEGWEIPHWAWEKTGHVSENISISNKQASEGKNSLEVSTNFPGDDWNEAILEIMQFFNWGSYGKISTDVYLPEDAPVGLEARIILTVGEKWEWREMKCLQQLQPGEWVTITADLKPGSLDWQGVRPDDAFRKDVRKMVVRIESYNRNTTYKGPIYIDNIRVDREIKTTSKKVKSE